MTSLPTHHEIQPFPPKKKKKKKKTTKIKPRKKLGLN